MTVADKAPGPSANGGGRWCCSSKYTFFPDFRSETACIAALFFLSDLEIQQFLGSDSLLMIFTHYL